jgi:hypothetical protein
MSMTWPEVVKPVTFRSLSDVTTSGPDVTAQPAVSVNAPATQKSNVVCASALSPIPEQRRSSCGGCSGLVPRIALVASTSNQCWNASSSGCTRAC